MLVGFGQNREFGRNVSILDEGITLTPSISSLDITGGGAAATSVSDDVTLNVPGAAYELGDPVTKTHGGTGSTTAEFSPTINVDIFHYYVSPTGSDSNNGLTALTPFLTVKKALDTIPLIMGRVYQVNVAAGSNATAAVYEFRNHVSSYGNTDSICVIKLVGADLTDPSQTLITGATSTSNIFINRNPFLLVDIDGIQFDTCMSALRAEGGRFHLRGVNVNQYRGSSILANNGGIITTDTTAYGGVLTAVTGVTTTGVSCSNASITISKPTFTIQGYSGSSSGAAVSANGSIVFATTTLNITADPTAKSRFGLSANSGGVISLRNTVNLSNELFSSAGDGLIRVFSFGRISMVSGATVNFANANNGWSIDSNGSVSEGNTCTYNYSSVTTDVSIAHGGIVDSTNFLGASTIVYRAATFSSPLYGYDDRYDRKPTRTAVADAAYTVLVSDQLIAYTSLSTTRIVTFPTVANATAGMSAGQRKDFILKDESLGCSAIKKITSQVSGGALIEGAASVDMTVAGGVLRLYCYVGGTNYFIS